jgi:hypothetical protein
MEKEKKEMVLKAINELKPTDKKEDFYKKVGDELSQDEADIIFEAYQKGCYEYNMRAWNAEDKYQKLCIKVCEKFI